MRIGWLSDVHLNFLDEESLDRFFAGLAAQAVDAWLVSGDIGEAQSVTQYLQMFETRLPCPTYFTLGNHDFYGGSMAEVHLRVRDLAAASRRLVWLTASPAETLGGGTAITGDDSWADARFGNARKTPVELNDFFFIRELVGWARPDLIRMLHRLGDQAAARLEPKLRAAADSHDRVYVLMHVPPFREAAWHRGELCDDDWAPWFSCRAVGDVVRGCARDHPDVEFIVLCGHTHGGGRYAAAPNLTVLTAEAEYGAPASQGIFEIRPRDGG